MAKILIIEDDWRTAEEMAAQLSAAGHTCAIRAEGMNVLDVIRKGSPDLLVLDIMLPDASGFEICRSIRRDEDYFLLPILVVSAMNDSEEIEHGLAQGADMYIPKPYDAQTFVRRVNALLTEFVNNPLVDPATQLPNQDAIRRELQKRIGREEVFALVYAEVTHLRELGKIVRAAGREKAVRRVGRVLSMAGREVCGEHEPFVGHMGSGHFMCLMPQDRAEEFSRYARKIWRHHVTDLYAALGQGHLVEAAEFGDGRPVLDLQCYVTFRRDADAQTAQDLIDTVSRIRGTVPAGEAGAVHVDRRA